MGKVGKLGLKTPRALTSGEAEEDEEDEEDEEVEEDVEDAM